jgi:hypothetical protein
MLADTMSTKNRSYYWQINKAAAVSFATGVLLYLAVSVFHGGYAIYGLVFFAGYFLNDYLRESWKSHVTATVKGDCNTVVQ